MKVLFAGIIMDSQWRGGEPKIARAIISELKKRNVKIFCDSFKRNKIAMYFSRLFNPTDVYPPAYIHYLKLLQKLKPDLVVGWFDYDISLYAASLKLKIPIIAAVHIYWPICPLLTLWLNNKMCPGPNHANCFKHCVARKSNLLSKFCFSFLNISIRLALKKRKNILNKVSAIIVLSDYVKQKMINYGYNQNKIKVIPNGINLTSFRPQILKQRKGNSNIILYFAARASESKGFYDFLKIVEILKKKHPELKFMATGNKPENVKDKEIEFTGYLPEKKIINLLEEVFIVIIPSKWGEPFGLVNIEAMAMKKPVVAYANGAIPEIIKSDFNGFLVKNANIKGMVKKIELLIKNNRLAEEIGKNARKTVEKKFDIKKISAKYYDVIKQILKNNKISKKEIKFKPKIF